MVHPSENASFKFHYLFHIQQFIQLFPHPEYLFESKLLSQGNIEKNHLSKNVKNSGFNKKTSFSPKSVKKRTIYNLLLLMAIYSLQNVNKHPSEMENQHQNILFTLSTYFYRFGAHFDAWLKIITYCQVFLKILFGTRLNYRKKNLVKFRVIAPLFRRQRFKQGVDYMRLTHAMQVIRWNFFLL